jgi:biotin carboxylase
MLHGAFYDGIHEARRHGIEIWLFIKDREWYGSPEAWRDHPLNQVDRLILTDTHDAEAVFAELADDTGRPLVDGVTTFSDYHTELAATVAARLGLPGPGVRPIHLANHKHLLREALRGTPFTVDHMLVTDPAQLPAAVARLGFPMVAKPPAEAISYGVRLVTDVDELVQAYAAISAIRHSLRGQPRPGHVLLESYVDAPEVSVESLTIDGVTHFYGITAKSLGEPPTFLEAAHAFPAAVDPGPVYRVVAETLRLIGYAQGPAHTEVKLTPCGPRIIEVNPRLPAGNITTMVRDVCGRDPHLDAKLLAVGRPVEPPRGAYDGGAAVVVLYPPRQPGTFLGLTGAAEAEERYGVRVIPLARPGDELWHRIDNSGRIGFVYARAADSATALCTAREAAGTVHIRVGMQV